MSMKNISLFVAGLLLALAFVSVQLAIFCKFGYISGDEWFYWAQSLFFFVSFWASGFWVIWASDK